MSSILCTFLTLFVFAVGARTQPIGIPNVVNSCFMNADLQALMVTPYFQTLQNISGSCLKVLNPITQQMRIDLINFYDKYQSSKTTNFTAKEIKELYDKFIKTYEIRLETAEGQQGDADEMIRAIGTKIQSQIDKNKLLCYTDPFSYRYTKQLSCIVCGRHWPKEERNNFLIATPSEGSTIIDIRKTVPQFFAKEYLPDFDCSWCKEGYSKSSTSQGEKPVYWNERVTCEDKWFAELPQALVIVVHLKDFIKERDGDELRAYSITVHEADGKTAKRRADGSTLTEEVWKLGPKFKLTEREATGCIVPESLNLSQLLQGHDQPPRFYRLASVVAHVGGFNGGHYVAYVRYGSTWWFCNDSVVKKADIKTAPQPWEDIYYGALPRLLFYVPVTPADTVEDLAQQLSLLSSVSTMQKYAKKS